MDDPSLLSLMILIALLPIYMLVTLATSASLSRPTGGDDDDVSKRRLTLTQQLLSTLILFVMALAAQQGLVQPLATALGSAALAYVVVILPLAAAVMIFGEYVPRAVGVKYDQQIGFAGHLLMAPLQWALIPLTLSVQWLSDRLVRLMGITEVATSITEEELLTLIDSGDHLEEEERKMLHSVLELDKTTVTEMMVPRIDVIAVEKGTSIADARKVFLESGHSRLPVYDDNIDHIVGLVYVKDLLEVWHNGHTVVGSVEEIMRQAHFVPEDMTADQLLQEFQRQKIHMAIVIEEYGGTGGLVTLENLLEEIVGDIQDEYDENESEEILKLTDTEYRVDAGMALDDLNDTLDVELTDEDVDTLGGFIFNKLERVPEEGEVILTEEVELRVLSVEGRRIREVHVTKLITEADEDEASVSDETADTETQSLAS